MREHQRQEEGGGTRSAPERRRAYRVKTPGARADCVVLVDGQSADGQGIYELVDVSPEGARLHGDLAVEGALVVGAQADMLLRSPGRLIPTNGHIVREHVGPREDGGDEVEVGVAFDHPWPGAREAVEDMMVDYIIRRHEHPAGPAPAGPAAHAGKPGPSDSKTTHADPGDPGPEERP